MLLIKRNAYTQFLYNLYYTIKLFSGSTKLIKVQYAKNYVTMTLFIYITITHTLYDQNIPDTLSVITIVTNFLFSKLFSPGFGNPHTNTVLFSGADRTLTV